LSQCCPTTYWCTPEGLVGVDPDADGYYTPPDGATGGPYATSLEGLYACRSAEVGCREDCPFTYQSPLIVTLENPTGDLIEALDTVILYGGEEPPPLDEQCTFGGGTGTLATAYIHPLGFPPFSYNPGLVLSVWISFGGGIFERWTVSAQNQGLYDYTTKWISHGPGYGAYSDATAAADPNRECGFHFYEGKTLIGRIQLLKFFAPYTVYGEADVYVE
jgi:hypothetical protein